MQGLLMTSERRRRWRIRLLRRAFSFLLFVADASGFSLGIPNFTEVKPNCTSSKRVGLGLAAMFLIGGTEAANEGVEAAPSLAEGAGARSRGIGVAVEGAKLSVDLGFPKLVQVAEEF